MVRFDARDAANDGGYLIKKHGVKPTQLKVTGGHPSAMAIFDIPVSYRNCW